MKTPDDRPWQRGFRFAALGGRILVTARCPSTPDGRGRRFSWRAPDNPPKSTLELDPLGASPPVLGRRGDWAGGPRTLVAKGAVWLRSQPPSKETKQWETGTLDLPPEERRPVDMVALPGGGPPPGPPGGPGGYGGPPGGPPPGGYGGPPGGPPPGGYGAPPPGGFGGPPGGYGAPPPGGFGGPPGQFGQPPIHGMAPAPGYAMPVQGSIALGFLAGFLGGCIGLGLVYALAKGPDTKKGAGIGFAAQIMIGAVLRIVAR